MFFIRHAILVFVLLKSALHFQKSQRFPWYTHFKPYYSNIQLSHSSIETHLSFEGINDELKSMRLDTLNALLHHMVAILILHTL